MQHVKANKSRSLYSQNTVSSPEMRTSQASAMSRIPDMCSFMLHKQNPSRQHMFASTQLPGLVGFS